mgnify:CR=1 FL=1
MPSGVISRKLPKKPEIVDLTLERIHAVKNSYLKPETNFVTKSDGNIKITNKAVGEKIMEHKKLELKVINSKSKC